MFLITKQKQFFVPTMSHLEPRDEVENGMSLNSLGEKLHLK